MLRPGRHQQQERAAFDHRGLGGEGRYLLGRSSALGFSTPEIGSIIAEVGVSRIALARQEKTDWCSSGGLVGTES
jgi:hypothetical protein